MRGLAQAACLALVAVAAPAGAQPATAKPLPRADFFLACPFTVAPPSVVAILDAARWRNVVAASRVSPPPYEAADTDFRRESIFIVALPHSPMSLTQGALSTSRPEKFDVKAGTLTIWYDVSSRPIRPGDAQETAIGQPCLITWTAARKDLLQVITRTSDGRYIAGTRTAEKPKKKS